MAQKQISSVEANAFIAATATNKEDFEDAKRLFKDSLKEALLAAQAESQIKVYQDALRGFLLELGQREASTLDKIRELRDDLRKATSQLQRIDLRLGVSVAVMFPLLGVLGWFLLRLLKA